MEQSTERLCSLDSKTRCITGSNFSVCILENSTQSNTSKTTMYFNFYNCLNINNQTLDQTLHNSVD